MEKQVLEITETLLSTLSINCFRAIDNPLACENFSEGHFNVLKDFGVKQVTSANKTWHKNPNSYVISVGLPNKEEFVAGARVDIYGGKSTLPIEEAVGEIDKSIFELVSGYGALGTAEVCGLWSAKETAGNGLAFLLIKSSIVVANLLQLGSLFALCSPFTVSMFSKVGFEVEKSLGNEGTFYYPKLDLIATAMLLKDLAGLDHALPENRNCILELIKTPHKCVLENSPKGKIKTYYNLSPFL